MKVLHAGPTLPDAHRWAGDILVRGPAIQGDVYRAVEEGAGVIGIVDGGFEYTAPVWHKEILYALSAGVTVLGAASMGALRAAECHVFGMRGVGEIFREYAEGTRIDDSDVAQVHGPAELGWLPLSEPLVNIPPTLDALVQRHLVDPAEAERLDILARSIFFKDRTWRSIIARAGFIGERRAAAIIAAVKTCHVNRKRTDALELLDLMTRCSGIRVASRRDWQLHRTSLWNEMMKQHSTA